MKMILKAKKYGNNNTFKFTVHIFRAKLQQVIDITFQLTYITDTDTNLDQHKLQASLPQ